MSAGLFTNTIAACCRFRSSPFAIGLRSIGTLVKSKKLLETYRKKFFPTLH
jgi:hypothetical protein